MRILTSTWFWVLVIALALIGAGWYVKGVFEERARLKLELAAEKKARDDEKALQRIASQADVRYTENSIERERKADERNSELRSALARSGSSLASCRIDNSVLRVLNAGVGSGTPRDAADDPPGRDLGAGPGSTCEALALTFDENRRRFDRLNAKHSACVAFYDQVRTEYCKRTGAC